MNQREKICLIAIILFAPLMLDHIWVLVIQTILFAVFLLPHSAPREKLADLAHRQWSGWMEYLFSKGTLNHDGTWTMPQWAVERWQRQMQTPYADLPEQEKENDRQEADRVLELFD